MEKRYTVKEVSERSGVSVRALHLWDEMGLLVPERLENGYQITGYYAPTSTVSGAFFCFAAAAWSSRQLHPFSMQTMQSCALP